jgi:hypothetical protein
MAVRWWSKQTSVVELADGAETFLACSIPYLETYDGSTISVCDSLGYKRGAYSRSHRGRRCEGMMNKAVDETGLADSLRAQHDQFCLYALRVRGRHICMKMCQSSRIILWRT